MTEQHYRFEDMYPGLRFQYQRQVSAEDIADTVRLTGDRGGYHVDPEFARSAGFQGLIAPGLFTMSLLTKIGGDVNFLAREFQIAFLKPVKALDTLNAEMEVLTADPVTQLVTCRGTVTNQDGVRVLESTIKGYLPKAEWGIPNRS